MYYYKITLYAYNIGKDANNDGYHIITGSPYYTDFTASKLGIEQAADKLYEKFKKHLQNNPLDANTYTCKIYTERISKKDILKHITLSHKPTALFGTGSLVRLNPLILDLVDTYKEYLEDIL